jgi:phenylalanyl-tRNA synthetase beta chain
LKVTLNWLKEFLGTEEYLDPAEIAEILTMSGTEVKKVEYLGERYKDMVVGQIMEYRQHPNADKLTVCQVDIGRNILNIVCGATNLKKKDKVVVALEGSTTAQGITIRRSKIRGVYSEGMMCSEAELGLSEDAAGIMILDKSFKVGEDFAKSISLDDVVFELEITPNRPDCLNVMGIAREISALKRVPFKAYKYEIDSELNHDNDFEIEIKDYILCPRYSAKIFTDIPKIDSPEWLKNRLTLCDYRPIDLIVDLTNYVMHEIGQPLHAFDKDLLYSNKIIIRTAGRKEQIRTIDDTLRNLSENMLVIADEKRPVAIAGIMGGKDTEINPDTKSVLLESANFFGPSIMRTSNALGLRSEASNRFEKKIDPELTVLAIKRFEDLLSSITGYAIKKGIYDNYKRLKRERHLSLNLDNIKNILGKDINVEEISSILNYLGIKCNHTTYNKRTLEATIPSSRFEDVEREIDLVEEIARIYGFENFKAVPPVSFLHKGKYTFYQKTLKNLRQVLCDAGLDEVMNYSFISEEWIIKLKLDQEDNYKNAVEIINPINEEFAYLRTTPMPSMIKNVLNNINHEIKDISIFEITKVYEKLHDSKLPKETNLLGVMLSGRLSLKSWNKQEKNFDFYDLKAVLEYLFEHFYKKSNLEINQKGFKFFHPIISGEVIINGIPMGIIGKIHPGILDNLDIAQDIYYLELNLDKFIENIKYSRDFSQIPSYPSIDIDLAIVVDEDLKCSDIENEIKKSGTEILKSVKLFDIYRGKQIEDGRKSMAYSLTFQDETRTLKDMEVEIIVKRILENLAKKFKAKLRE